MMTDARVMSIQELKAFLLSSDVFTFKGSSGRDIRLDRARIAFLPLLLLPR
jgi:hypothetical protein